jgi:hypothetical protein
MVALRLCLERLYPPMKSRRVSFNLPKIETAKDLPAASAAVSEAMAGGEISPDEASVIANVLETHRRALELSDLEERLSVIEKRITENGKGN